MITRIGLNDNRENYILRRHRIYNIYANSNSTLPRVEGFLDM